MTITTTYTLAHEEKKLAARAKIFDRHSKLFLPSFIRPGQKILEIGCGMGGATLLIARLLNQHGFIDAVDMNADYLDFVTQRLQVEGFYNFSVKQALIEDLKTPGNYDVIYGRAILHHLPDAKSVLRHLLSFLKPQGLIAFEEPIVTSVFAQPENNAFKQLLQWYYQLGLAKGVDYNLGMKLPLYFQDLAIDIFESRLLQIALLDESERIAMLDLVPTLEKQFLEYKIADKSQIKSLRESLDQLVHSQQIMYHGQFCQILGQVR